MRRLLFCVLIPVFCTWLVGCGTVSHTQVRDTTRTFKTVVVDAGHGGKDNGATRRYGGSEKTATLDVAVRLAAKLREANFRTVMTRSSDVFVDLNERVRISNRQSNAIFVSIHFNDSRRRGIRGFETYYYSPAARDLAYRIQRNLLTIPGSANRGVKTANFRVLRNAAYPAVLVECGFLSNQRDGASARRAAYRDQLADRIAEAIVATRRSSSIHDGPTTAAQ